jgi:hypothetical protein
MMDGVDMESDKSKLDNPLEKRDREEEKKIQEPPQSTFLGWDNQQ